MRRLGTVIVFGLAALARGAPVDFVTSVRIAIARGNLRLADSEIQSYRAQHGVTPEMLEAL